MRRRTLRPSSRTTLVFLVMVIAFLVWTVGELGRSRVGRALLAALSAGIFVFFAVGWSTR